MNKFIEITKEEGSVERYKISNISINDFIDTHCSGLVTPDMWKDITEERYESDKKFELAFNVEGNDSLFSVEHYYVKFPDKETRNEWYRFIRQHNRGEEFMRMVTNDEGDE